MNCLSFVSKTCIFSLILAVSIGSGTNCFALQEADIKVVGFATAIKNPDSEYNAAYASGVQPGTHVHLRIVLKDQHITEVHGVYKDFTMTDSTGKKMKMGYGNMSFMSTIADDAASVVCPVTSDEVASGKANSLTLKGAVTCVLGANEKEDEIEVKIEKDVKLKMAGLDFEIKDVRDHYDEGTQIMTFQTNKQMSAIKSIQAVMADDKISELESAGNSSWGSEGNMTVQRELVVKGKASDIKKLKVTYFKDLKEFEVPIDVTVGFGLSK